MFFLITIILLIAYNSQARQVSTAELWFMTSVFVGLAYVAGFLDSRLFRRWDRKNENRLAESEARYEAQFESTSELAKPV